MRLGRLPHHLASLHLGLLCRAVRESKSALEETERINQVVGMAMRSLFIAGVVPGFEHPHAVIFKQYLIGQSKPVPRRGDSLYFVFGGISLPFSSTNTMSKGPPE